MPYFSSYSDRGSSIPKNTANKMIARFGLSSTSFVVEVASNDGYLLQYFVKRKVPVLGIEPAANVAKVAVEKGSSHAGAILRRATREGTGRRRPHG